MEEKNNEIIDVEVSEETVNEQKYSDAEIDEMRNQLKELIISNNYKTNEDIENLSEKIAYNSKDYLDDETYFWVMYAYGLRYKGKEDKESKNSYNFILAELYNYFKMKDGKKRRAQALTFKEEFVVDEKLKAEILKDCSFIEDTIKKTRRKFLFMEIGMGLIFAAVAIFFVKISVISALLIAAGITAINYFISIRNIERTYLMEQVRTSKSYCNDEEIKDFDLPVLNS